MHQIISAQRASSGATTLERARHVKEEIRAAAECRFATGIRLTTSGHYRVAILVTAAADRQHL
jgi:hypothetical protein